MSTKTRQQSDLLARFEREYQQYHGISAKRRQQQLSVLRRYEAHAERSLIDCGAPEFGAFLAFEVDRGLHVNTVRRNGNMIRPFYTWAFEKGLITGDQLMHIRSVKNPRGSSDRSLPKPYTAKDLKHWRAELDARYPLLPDYRLRYFLNGQMKFKRVADHAMRLQIEAITALALYCGLRRSEIFALEIDDLHPDNAYVVVRQRGERENGKDKFREVPHTKQSRAKIEEWLEFRDRLAPPHDRPWLSLAANQPEGKWLNAMYFGRFEELLTTVGHWHYHRFRHTAATNWLRAGMSLAVVSRLLGHTNITQTLGYAAIVREDIQKAVERHEDTFEEQINGTEG